MSASVFFSALKKRYRTFAIIIIYVLFTMFYATILFLDFPWKRYIPPFVLPFLPTLIAFKNHPFQQIFVVFTVITFDLVVSALSSVVSQIFDPWGSVEFLILYTILFCGISLVVAILAMRLGKSFFNRLFSYTSPRMWALYSLAPGISFFLVRTAVFSHFQIPPPYIEDIPGTLLLLFLVVTSLTLVMVAIITTRGKAEMSFALKQAGESLSAGREYYQLMSKTHEEIRFLRHDYKHQLNVLEGLLREGRVEDMKVLLNSMEQNLDDAALPVYSPNPVINSLVYRYALSCGEHGIDFSFRSQLPRESPVDHYDLSVLLGNLLENALEACLTLPGDKEKYIAADIRYQGNQLCFQVKNSFDGILIMQNGEIRSRKNNGGLGIRSIRAVCARYNGDYLPEAQGGEFTAYVLLNI